MIPVRNSYDVRREGAIYESDSSWVVRRTARVGAYCDIIREGTIYRRSRRQKTSARLLPEVDGTASALAILL